MSSSTFANHEYYAYISYSSVEAASNNKQRRTISRPTLETRVMSMDLRYGLTTRVKDPNNSELRTINDGLGRLTSVRSPNEVNDSSTIDMSYAPIAVLKADGTGIQTPAHAVATYHLRQPFERGSLVSTYSDVMRVITFVDGFGNLLQTHRMASATQSYGSPRAGFYATDTLSMAYDDLWRITSKSQRLSQVGVMSAGTLNTGYALNYNYDTAWGKHYQMKNVAETHYRTAGTPTDADNILSTHSYSYDPNGNLTYESVARKRYDNTTTTQKISERKLLWDSQNRLRGISDNGYVSLYWYDADGNRTVKEHLGGEAVWVNGMPASQNTDSVSYSIYPNPYISINGDRWTKHYYIGGERIASRTGTIGKFSSLNGMNNLPAGDGIVDSVAYSALRLAQEDSIASMFAQLGVPYEVHRTTTRNEGAHLHFPITRTGKDEEGLATAMASEAGNLRNHPNTLGEGQVYFYLRDHLGSTLSVTDSVGNYVQQVEYTPWGEVFVEQHNGNSGYTTPYLFNGKEMDEETGLYYYGARYYDPKMSVWYSTDPMEMDYPWASTYTYTKNNPLRYVDPDGNDEWDINQKGVIVKHTTTTKHDAFFITDKKGRRIKGGSIFFKYGTVEKATTQKNVQGILYDVYQIRGDIFSSQLFEHFADITSVEWSLMQTGVAGEKGLNFITTSHSDSEEAGMTSLFKRQLKYGYTIRKDIHSHPKNTPYPSGLDEKKPGDVQYARMVTNISTQSPVFQIYLPKSGKYIEYGPNSIAADFDPNTLPEVIIKSTKIRK